MYRKFHRLRVRFAELDMSQAEAARRAGIPPSTLTARMTGRLPFTARDIAGLCKALDMNIQLHGSDPVSVDSRFIYDPSSNDDTDLVSSMLPNYFGLIKPLDEEDGTDPSAGVVLLFDDSLAAKAPSTELVITPKVNSDGVPVLAVSVNVL